MHCVIIGNGGAGVSALQSIREIDKKSDITIISREKYPAYSPCSLPNLLAGEIDKPTIFRFDKEFYNRLNLCNHVHFELYSKKVVCPIAVILLIVYT